MPGIASAEITSVRLGSPNAITGPLEIKADGGNDRIEVSCVNGAPLVTDLAADREYGFQGRRGCKRISAIKVDTRGGDDRVNLFEVRRTKSSFGTCKPSNGCYLIGKFAHVDTGDGDDTLIGTGFPDKLEGGNGDDLLKGKHGNDQLRGESGRDKLYGEDGDDGLFGGPGPDELHPGPGHDHLEQ